MQISFKNKVIVVLTVYMTIGGIIWFLNYYNNNLLNRTLRIIEKKEDLLNTILEARRYEKNFFLTLNSDHLDSADTFIQQAEKKLTDLALEKNALPSSAGFTLHQADLADYRIAMAHLVALNTSGNTQEAQTHTEIETNQTAIRHLGRVITEASETMVIMDRAHINRLIRKTQVYHLATLLGMILITILAVVFFFFNVIRPLKMLEEAVGEIASGNYENVPSIAPAVEFESLVGSLNNMISMLNQRSEDLIQDKKLASIGTLTSGVAHELNNPLNNISTSLQIMLEELEDKDIAYKQELLTDAEKEVERARDIVRALLEFSRQHAFSIQTVPLRPIVEDTVKLIRGELPATVKLLVDIPDNIQAKVDTGRIQQVLINLIFNAIQAMEEGGSLTISARPGNAGEFYIKVTDTGKGIPSVLLSKIFDPFFSIKTTRRRSTEDSATSQKFLNHQGTGLGLAICHGIVKKHGGRIDVHSKPGEGATFTVHLPMESADEAIA